MINKQSGSAVLFCMALIACASIYAVSYYVINCDDDEDNYIGVLPEVYEIKPVNFLEPEDKCLFT